MEDFKQYFIDMLKELDLMLNNKQIENFYYYMNELIEWNKNINLTAITEEKEIIQKHFIDSLTIIKYLKNNDKIIDVGTGAGFPGIPLKISNETLDITLLDSLNKRILFLNNVIEKLKLNNIRTIHSRVEDAAINLEHREKYDIATSRAVAQLNVLLEYLLPLVKVGGKCICMKGGNIEEELKNSKKALEILGGKVEKIESFELPDSDIKRNIIIIKKVSHTPKIYPRKAGTPSKKPLI